MLNYSLTKGSENALISKKKANTQNDVTTISFQYFLLELDDFWKKQLVSANSPCSKIDNSRKNLTDNLPHFDAVDW